jgi:uncharacterized protein YbjT (DUF2867 family)
MRFGTQEALAVRDKGNVNAVSNSPADREVAIAPGARVLVAGANGYLGSRLIPELLSAGYQVRCLVRDLGRFDAAAFGEVEVAQGDALDPSSLDSALTNCEAAFYLIHSMASEGNFAAKDRAAATNFGQSAARVGVRRLVYLGGLGAGGDLSEHLRSRQETGDVLRASGVALTEFRAGMIVGSGSASFEMVRALTERLPVMIAPKWVNTKSQPIASRDVVQYLVGCLAKPETAGKVYEIGGADVLSYLDMMLGYAAARGLRRSILVVPVLTPRLSSYWVNLVSPVPASIARPLVEGLRHEVIVRDLSAATDFDLKPLGYRAAVDLALDRVVTDEVQSVWSQAASATDLPPQAIKLTSREGMVAENRSIKIEAPVAEVFAHITSLGGERGWLYANWAWQLRGLLDRLVGGIGMRRGRRSLTRVRVGDPIDFWRVESVEDQHRLLLRAEMKVPGRAWLEFLTEPEDSGTRVSMTAIFEPKGVFGRAYWWGLYPAHRVIFSGMLNQLKAACG